MLSKDANPILLKVAAQTEAKVLPQMKSQFQRIVLGGETIMYSDKTREMMKAELKQPGEPSRVVGMGVAKLVGLLISKYKGSADPKALIPAGTMLLCEAMDFAEKAGMLKVTNETMATATHAMFAALLQLMGVTPEKLQMLVHKAQRPNHGGQPPAQPTPAPLPQSQPAQPTPAAGGLVAQAQGVPA